MAKHSAPTSKAVRRADQYDDPSYNYLQYWEGREYENAAEELAIRRLLKGKHFQEAVDVGGGYGRLSVLLEDFADHVVLAEPSQQQLDLARKYLREHSSIDRRLMQASDLQFGDSSVDLVIMIRVMHHLPNPVPEFEEIYRILSPDGYAIIEVANYAHALNRLKHLLRRQRLPIKPVDIRSEQNRSDDEIPFVNHNPNTVARQLAHAGFKVERTLSVSNLRNPRLKRLLSKSVMLRAEHWLQPALASVHFGPSVFFLVKKAH